MGKFDTKFDGTWKSHKQWIRERGAEEMEDAEDFGEIKRLPTFIDLKCPRCGHRGRAKYHGRTRPRFRCSKCGATT